MLSGLGDLQSRLYGALIAAKQSGLPEKSYQNLRRAADLLVVSEDYLPKHPDAARARFVDAQRLFRAEEQICINNNPAYCTKFGVETFASIFREDSARVLKGINNPAKPLPPSRWNVPQYREREWTWENYVLLGLGALGAYVVFRGIFKGAKAVGAGAAAGTRAAREVIKA
jgi:transcriptional regulator with XRE-family HTH domain